MMSDQRTLSVTDFFAEQRKKEQLFGLVQPEPGTVRLLLWMEGYNDFHRVYVDIPEKAISQIHPTEQKVLLGGTALTLAKVDFVDGIESYFTINDLFDHLQEDCIVLLTQSDEEIKARRGAQVDDKVARQQGVARKKITGLNSQPRPII